jgi:phosphatidylethanolamine-binding protein (PEBP) family uncharacterized protein
MKAILLAIVILWVPALFAQQQEKQPQNARDYFIELRDLNTFNRYTDKYVCFLDDNDAQGFVIMSTIADIKAGMLSNGAQDGLKAVAKLGSGMLVQTYFKGVSNGEPIFYEGVTDTEYRVDYDAPIHHGRSVYMINWKTGRYRLQVFALDHSKTAALEVFGKCDLIHPNDTPSVLTPR